MEYGNRKEARALESGGLRSAREDPDTQDEPYIPKLNKLNIIYVRLFIGAVSVDNQPKL